MFSAIRKYEMDTTASVHVQGGGSNMNDIAASSPGRQINKAFCVGKLCGQQKT